MLVTPVTELPVGPEWTNEPKLNGWRVQGEYHNGRTSLTSRNGHAISDRFLTVVHEIPDALQGEDAVLDGEMVGFDSRGQVNFTELQRKRPRVVWHVFDILEVHGEPIIWRPWTERREILDKLVVPTDHIKIMPSEDDLEVVRDAVMELNQEGIVSKLRTSPYRPGVRSHDWRKLILNPEQTGFGRRKPAARR